MNLAHKFRHTHWCQKCELALKSYEVDVVELPSEQGCDGAMALYLDTCGVCGEDVEEYIGQDVISA